MVSCCFSQTETSPGPGPASHNYSDLNSSQNHKSFYLENVLNPDKKVQLPQHHVTLFVNEMKKNDPGILSRFNTMECFFDTLLGDSLSVRIINEEIEIERLHLFSSITNNYYAGSFSASFRKINIADVRYLSMKNPLRTNLSKIGAVVMSLSILTLVASPFAGMGLEGEQKAQKRAEVFVAGITGFAIAIPFFVLGRNKKYGLQPDFDAKGKNQWALKQKR